MHPHCGQSAQNIRRLQQKHCWTHSHLQVLLLQKVTPRFLQLQQPTVLWLRLQMIAKGEGHQQLQTQILIVLHPQVSFDGGMQTLWIVGQGFPQVSSHVPFTCTKIAPVPATASVTPFWGQSVWKVIVQQQIRQRGQSTKLPFGYIHFDEPIGDCCRQLQLEGCSGAMVNASVAVLPSAEVPVDPGEEEGSQSWLPVSTKTSGLSESPDSPRTVVLSSSWARISNKSKKKMTNLIMYLQKSMIRAQYLYYPTY